MNIELFDKSFDVVIQSVYIVAKIDFEFAIDKLVPLIDKYPAQRFTLKSNIYKKLESDLLKGCIMPPLTISFCRENPKELYELQLEKLKPIIEKEITNSYVLDGIQRLNTLNKIKKSGKTVNTPIYLNILISDTSDKLLYRMITLNNGQKPMSARHQIEILADNMYNFDSLCVSLTTEKEEKTSKIKNKEDISFTKENLIKAYLAFISNSINFDNQKIINEKLDELISEKVLESSVPETNVTFNQVINYVKEHSKNAILYKWFNLSNNMIGFCAAAAYSFDTLSSTSNNSLDETITNFEKAFTYINRSKINVGTARRKAVQKLILNYSKWEHLSVDDMIVEISECI